jgi:hypothetical protein
MTGQLRVRWWAVATVVAALVVTACGAGGDTDEPAVGDDTEQRSADEQGTADEQAADGVTFGDLPSPCGPGEATVAEGEGPSTDTLVLGVPNDRGADAVGRPGLNRELWEASQAFATWCNDQGGVQGLPIELVELDGKATAVEAAMAQACTGVFAMVGGGFVQDQLQFSGNPGTDFHECGLIDLPAFTVSIQKSGSNGKVEAIPNPADAGASQWVRDFAALYPEQSEQMVVVTGDLPSFAALENLFRAAADAEGIDLLPNVEYPFTGATDWSPYADAVIESGAQSVYFIGAPDNAANLRAKLLEKGWDGVTLHQTNTYDELAFAAGDEAAEGMVIRTAFHPFEEADRWPAVQQYLDLVATVPDAKVASLGLQSMSAWLLFATAADACATANDGVIDRTCVLTEAAAVEDWTGGGLHAPSDPGGDEPPSCGMLLVVRDGGFERLWPELDGEGDDADGFSCPEDSIVTADTSELGEGAVDPDRPI